jgi:hypothetical protein
MDLRLGTWNVGSFYRVSSLIKILNELSRYVRFSGSAGGQMGGCGTEPAGEYTFFYGEEYYKS